MSAFAVQSEQPPAEQSVYGTKDPILATTLGNLGFQARNALPVMLVVNAASVIDLVDKNSGRVADCAHLEFRFEAQIRHPVFGVLSAPDVFVAHEIAKLAQKVETKEISGAETLRLEKLRARWSQKRIGTDGVNHSATLLWAVQGFYDQVTNWLVVCSVCKELAKNPMIEYSKQVFRGVAYAVEPAETEPQAQRRSERLFRK